MVRHGAPRKLLRRQMLYPTELRDPAAPTAPALAGAVPGYAPRPPNASWGRPPYSPLGPRRFLGIRGTTRASATTPSVILEAP